MSLFIYLFIYVVNFVLLYILCSDQPRGLVVGVSDY